MTDDNKTANAGNELKMSAQALAAAERNAAAGDYATAVNRLYYAAYHAAMAVLLSEGLEPKSHRGVSHLLRLHFIEKDLLADWVEPTFSKVQSERELVDYEAAYSIDAQRYAKLSAETNKLLRELERLLRERGVVS